MAWAAVRAGECPPARTHGLRILHARALHPDGLGAGVSLPPGHRRQSQVWRLHDSDYSQVLRSARRPSRFIPHMTVGHQREEAARQAGRSEATEMSLPLTGRALSLTIYRREKDGRRVRELDMPP